MKLRKILAMLLTGALVLSLAACGGGGGASSAEPAKDAQDSTEPAPPEPEEEAPAEESHDVESIDLETESGRLVYSSYEFNDTNYDSRAVILTFDFTNKNSKPTGVQSSFSITVYQNGAEVEGPSSWTTPPELPEGIDNYFNTAMKDGTMPISRAYMIKDESPLTIMVEDRDNSDNYQMMELDISSGSAASGQSGNEAAPAGDDGGSDTSAPGTVGVWSVGYYVDDFQQPTDDWYITNESSFEGTFSNSATTNSRLLVQVAADEFEGEARVAFFLYEYGRNQVKNNSSNYVDEYDVTMRDAGGNDVKMSGTVYCGGDRLFIDDQYVNTVLEAMKGEGTLSFHIVDTQFTTTSYLFSFETDNFGSVYADTAG